MCALLTAAGWVEVSQKGSHKKFKRAGSIRHIIVPVHGNKELKPGLAAKIIADAGLTWPPEQR
jgi:predicted RNA binding protein YcfA (HicA-like mRNA interferase family)